MLLQVVRSLQGLCSLCSILIAVTLIESTGAQAASRGVTVLESFDVDFEGKSYDCGGPISAKYVVGTFLSNGNFLTTSSKISQTKKSLKTASGSKRTKLQNALKKLRVIAKNVGPLCAAGPGVTPTPTGNFDGTGNVTATGKIVFGIPTALSANLTRGRIVKERECGCHVDRLGFTYDAYRSRIALSPMFITLADQDLADLTAYLNRFRP